ncbi:MAG: T9SS type A sorting domain-containing protein [Bacteroidales bacterium]|jgi:hypothetical protein|nr:T9SS type A sorting domain-containing protein [Bacteroidales bacterium]
MKTRLYFLTLALLCGFGSFSQNHTFNIEEEDWACVYPNKKVYFEDAHKIVYCLRIDSIINDSIFYPFSDIHQIGDDCFSNTAGSWLSKYIVLNKDGNTVFVNGANQPILIKNKAELNEVWDVFTNNDMKVKGKITSISLKSVLGVEDSVKTVSFSVYNLMDEPIYHTLTQFSIEISKHFGLVKTVNFYHFEHNEYNLDLHEFGTFNFIGINAPQLGFQNPNLREQYFDFQIGDELHIRHLTNSFLYYYLEQKIILKYFSRSDYQDSIIYHSKRTTHNETKQFINGELVTNIYTTIDTLKETIVKGLLFTTEPNELYDISSKIIIINNPSLLTCVFNDEELQTTEDDCLRPVIADGCDVPAVYYSGLGGPYHSYCEMWNNSYAHDLVYYKKGNTESGTPFDFETSILEYEKDNYVNIYPNPVGDMLYISSSDKIALVELFDMSGRKLFTQTYGKTIDVSSYSKGLYILKVQETNGQTHSFSIVKK